MSFKSFRWSIAVALCLLVLTPGLHAQEDEEQQEEPMEEVEEVKADHMSHIKHCENFIRAIRYGDDLNGEIEVGYRAAMYAHLGNISYWADDRVVYNEKRNLVTSSVKANGMLKPSYRDPWKFPDLK